MGYSGLIGETISVRGHNGDQLEAYLARPLGVAPAPGVVRKNSEIDDVVRRRERGELLIGDRHRAGAHGWTTVTE